MHPHVLVHFKKSPKMFEVSTEYFKNSKFLYVMVKPLSVETHLNISNFDDGVRDAIYETKFPWCWRKDISDSRKRTLSFKIPELSRVERENIIAIQHFVDSFDQISFYDHKYKFHKMKSQYVNNAPWL